MEVPTAHWEWMPAPPDGCEPDVAAVGRYPTAAYSVGPSAPEAHPRRRGTPPAALSRIDEGRVPAIVNVDVDAAIDVDPLRTLADDRVVGPATPVPEIRSVDHAGPIADCGTVSDVGSTGQRYSGTSTGPIAEGGTVSGVGSSGQRYSGTSTGPKRSVHAQEIAQVARRRAGGTARLSADAGATTEVRTVSWKGANVRSSGTIWQTRTLSHSGTGRQIRTISGTRASGQTRTISDPRASRRTWQVPGKRSITEIGQARRGAENRDARPRRIGRLPDGTGEMTAGSAAY